MIRRTTLFAAVALAGLVVQGSVSAAPPAAVPPEPIRVVYHINEIDKARGLLANVRNHLRDDPQVSIVVIANGAGIDFLLKGAVDKAGVPFAPALNDLRERGVRFAVCRNTLAGRQLGDDAVAEGFGVVQAAVAEIARLQAREGHAYLKP